MFLNFRLHSPLGAGCWLRRLLGGLDDRGRGDLEGGAQARPIEGGLELGEAVVAGLEALARLVAGVREVRELPEPAAGRVEQGATHPELGPEGDDLHVGLDAGREALGVDGGRDRVLPVDGRLLERRRDRVGVGVLDADRPVQLEGLPDLRDRLPRRLVAGRGRVVRRRSHVCSPCPVMDGREGGKIPYLHHSQGGESA